MAPSKHGNLLRKTAVFEGLRAPRGLKIGPQRLLGAFLDRLGLLKAPWSVLGFNFGPHFGPPFGTQTGPEPFPTSFFRLLTLPRALQEAL